MEAIAHLSKDRKLKRLINTYGPLAPTRRRNIYLHLCYSIMSQQLSTRVAAVLQDRFIKLYGGKSPSAQAIVDTPFETLRGIGLSNAKTLYIQNVARFELEKGMSHTRLNKMSNEEVIEYLTEIKGVGRWTVEMLLMFSLGREDLFALDDLGLQNAMIDLYKLDGSDRKKLKGEIERIAQKWAPYRTYACLYLWRWKDGE
ncbi:MAG: DNA-3-methyladenine glycosylase 2 family protein [Chitinophagaceae bacterium]|nr:DNA-3-methyladenine glycosylase 2 family protein [Chitinophagaceae bacterium]MBN8666044.1 DNA-3-methyladenine glycosylase 2 family protein [Chitinophagales bacterium]